MLAIQEEPCDFRILGTSPIFGKDYFGNSIADYIPPYFEDDIAAEVHVECGPSYDERDFLYSESTSATTSCGTSVTSEISEDSFLDVDDFDPFPDTKDISIDFDSLQDRLADSVKLSRSSRQQRHGIPNSSDSDEDEEDVALQRGRMCAPEMTKLKSLARNTECSCCRLRKKMEKMYWKEMSADDQMEAIEYLTRLASTTLGLREQLEIIRIISPNARVLPTDTEFVIDLDAFDDLKFQRIHQYISQRLPIDDCHHCLEFRRKVCRQNSRSNRSHRKHSKTSRQPLSTKHISRKSKKPKGLLGRVHRQMEKEKRSGLFQKEEVISLQTSTSPDCEEDIEVDVL